MPPKQATTNSGIATSEDGSRHIPSSVRADGSVRKAIKVRPGFRPAEDVELYKNRTAEAFKNRGKTTGVPGAELVSKPSPVSKPSKPKAEAPKPKTEPKKEEVKVPEVKEEVDPEVEKEKEAKKIAKKLRQARDLQKKQKDAGAQLLPEQFQKVIRINELIRQLENMGFDEEGAKKDGA